MTLARLGAVALGAIALALTGVPAAQAAPAAPAAAPDAAVGHRVTQAPAAASAYWTSDRLARAIQADDWGGKAGVTGDAARPGPARTLAGARAGSARSTSALTAPALQGKVFFRNAANGLDYACSASSINNPTRNMVMTAGHCVHGGAGGAWHTNWVYIPLYANGSRPYGTWSAAYQTSFNGWIGSSDLNYDIGVVNVFPLDGQRLVDVVGGEGLGYNYGYSQSVTIWGYPSAFGYNGEWPYYCTGVGTYNTGGRVGAGCTLVEGASGGPWLINYNASNGLGTQTAVTSTRSDPPSSIQSPYFDSKIVTIWNATANL